MEWFAMLALEILEDNITNSYEKVEVILFTRYSLLVIFYSLLEIELLRL